MKIFGLLLPFLYKVVRTIGTSALTPVLEKNVVKTLATNSAFVVSMSRVIVVAFAAVMLKQFWQSGIGGWPDAALGIAIVLALPIMSSLEHANPDEILAVTRLLLAKFGGAGVEPSKLDDHRSD